MKTARISAFFLAILMLLSCASFVLAEDAAAYSPEVGDGYISIRYSEISGGICDRHMSATTEKATFDGKAVLKVVPTPDIADVKDLTLDSWSFSKYATKITIPDYKYVVVSYYYDTVTPSYTGKLKLNLLSGPTKALKTGASVESVEPMVTKQWAKATFNYSGKLVLNPDTDKPYLSQAHFLPFGGTDPKMLTSNDILYVDSFTFYTKNPDPNASCMADFVKGNPDAVGEAPKAINFKEGEKFTLPENTFELGYGTFKGWKSSVDDKVYPVGTEVTGGDEDLTFSAFWEEHKEYSDYISLDFIKYANGTVDKIDCCETYEATEYDGRSAMKVVPNASPVKAKTLVLDGWSYGGAGVDFDAYKWLVITYKYESPKPVEAKMRVNIMKNGNILAKGYGKDSTESLSADGWSFAKFDMTDIDAALDPNNAHILRQLHIYPFGTTPLANLTSDDIMYINQIMFFKEEPKLDVHSPYMTGYEDGTFKPDKTMSRAEACTVVARLLAPETDIAGTTSFTDVEAWKWYAKYIGFCEAKGLLKSYSGTFEPDKAITRAEFAELVFNTGLAKATDKTVSFSDVTEAHPKYEAIKAAASAGLITGYEDGTFLPDRTITRAQVVTVINRARGRDMTKETISPTFNIVFVDVDDESWAFANIAEAAVPHVAMDGKWVYAMKNPADMLGDNYIPDYTEGNAKIAEVDKLSADRKTAILASESDYSTITGKKYYVSNNGDNEKDGLTPETAWKTVSRVNGAPLAAGDGVLFERGGLWRERLTAKPGVTYSAYGTGDKPKIYGSPENGADASKWTIFYEDATTGAKIWKYSNEDMLDVGAITFNDGEVYGYKEIPNYTEGKFVVRGTADEFDIKKHLDRDFEYFHKADSAISNGTPSVGSAKGPLYLRCDKGNPGELFKTIEFNTKNNIIQIGGSGVTIDNLCVMYGGNHGIGSGTTKDLTVKNCVIGWIGGSIQTYNFRNGTDGRVTRFGNGIEIYGGCDNYNVLNCYVYQNYDAGMTHQYGDGTNNVTMDNVTYKGNLIEDCVYSIEYFLGASESGTNAKRSGKNILIEDNIMRLAGYGFGSTRPDANNQVHIKSWASRNEFENYVIKNNIFDRSVWNLLHICAEHEAWLPKMEGNTYIQGYKNKLMLFGRSSGTQYENNLLASLNIEKVLKDTTGKYYAVDTIPNYVFPYGTAK